MLAVAGEFELFTRRHAWPPSRPPSGGSVPDGWATSSPCACCTPATTSPPTTAPGPRPSRSPSTARRSWTAPSTWPTGTSCSSWSSADKDLEAVISGPGGLLTGGRQARHRRRLLHRVHRGVGARPRRAPRRDGAQFLAAPVSGNPKVIAAGKLTVAASGPRAAFEAAEPLLDACGRGVTYVGEGEGARLVKIAHNVFLGVVIQSLAEITVLAERGGVSRAAFLDVPQRLRARLGVHPLQVAGAGQPGLPPDVHHRCCSARTCSSACRPARSSACRCRWPPRPTC